MERSDPRNPSPLAGLIVHHRTRKDEANEEVRDKVITIQGRCSSSTCEMCQCADCAARQHAESAGAIRADGSTLDESTEDQCIDGGGDGRAAAAR